MSDAALKPDVLEVINVLRRNLQPFPDNNDPLSINDCWDMVVEDVKGLKSRVTELEACVKHYVLRLPLD